MVLPLTLVHPFSIRHCCPLSPLFCSRCSFFTPDSSFSLLRFLVSFFTPTLLLSDFSLPLSPYLSLPPFVASLGILSGSSLLLLFAPVFSVLLSFSLFLLHLLSPSPPAFLLRFSSPPPLLSLKVFAQSGSAQRGSTFCSYHPKWLLAAMSDASRLVPPMIFSHHCELFLCAAYDSGAAYVDGCCGSLAALLSLGTLLTTSGRVFTITCSLLLSFVLVCCLFSIPQKRWAKWDQPVAYCPARPPMLFSSSHIPCLGSTLSIL